MNGSDIYINLGNLFKSKTLVNNFNIERDLYNTWELNGKANLNFTSIIILNKDVNSIWYFFTKVLQELNIQLDKGKLVYLQRKLGDK